VAITEGDINLPGLGKIDKKYAIAGTLVAVGLGVIVYPVKERR